MPRVARSLRCMPARCVPTRLQTARHMGSEGTLQKKSRMGQQREQQEKEEVPVAPQATPCSATARNKTFKRLNSKFCSTDLERNPGKEPFTAGVACQWLGTICPRQEGLVPPLEHAHPHDTIDKWEREGGRTFVWQVRQYHVCGRSGKFLTAGLASAKRRCRASACRRAHRDPGRALLLSHTPAASHSCPHLSGSQSSE